MPPLEPGASEVTIERCGSRLSPAPRVADARLPSRSARRACARRCPPSSRGTRECRPLPRAAAAPTSGAGAGGSTGGGVSGACSLASTGSGFGSGSSGFGSSTTGARRQAARRCELDEAHDALGQLEGLFGLRHAASGSAASPRRRRARSAASSQRFLRNRWSSSPSRDHGMRCGRSLERADLALDDPFAAPLVFFLLNLEQVALEQMEDVVALLDVVEQRLALFLDDLDLLGELTEPLANLAEMTLGLAARPRCSPQNMSRDAERRAAARANRRRSARARIARASARASRAPRRPRADGSSRPPSLDSTRSICVAQRLLRRWQRLLYRCDCGAHVFTVWFSRCSRRSRTRGRTPSAGPRATAARSRPPSTWP